MIALSPAVATERLTSQFTGPGLALLAPAGDRGRSPVHNHFFLAQAVTTSKVSFSWGSAPPPAARFLDLARRNSEPPIPR